jgi:hypothetical protein
VVIEIAPVPEWMARMPVPEANRKPVLLTVICAAEVALPIEA